VVIRLLFQLVLWTERAMQRDSTIRTWTITRRLIPVSTAWAFRKAVELLQRARADVGREETTQARLGGVTWHTGT